MRGLPAIATPASPRSTKAKLELEVAGTEVLACHFPYFGDSHDMTATLEARPATGAVLLHGHVHERWRQRGR